MHQFEGEERPSQQDNSTNSKPFFNTGTGSPLMYTQVTCDLHKPLLTKTAVAEKLREEKHYAVLSQSATKEFKGNITPQNITAYYYQAKKNGTGLQITEELYCQDDSKDLQFQHTWIFDADDTLWEDNYYYEELKKMLVNYLLSNGCTLSENDINEEIHEADVKTSQSLGFGPIGFAESLKIAFDSINQKSKVKIAKPDEFFAAIVPILTHLPLDIPVETINMLKHLRESGHGLVLYTRGNASVQLPKIARSELGQYFHAVGITKNKTAVELRRLLETQITFKAGEFSYVGNSLKSDIKPAVEVSIRAFYFDNPNTWMFEHNVHLDKEKYKYTTIKQLSELRAHLDSKPKHSK